MKRNTLPILLFSIMFVFTSCLTDGLDVVEMTNECEITNLEFEHRWVVNPGTTEGMGKLYFQKLTVAKQINKDAATVTVQLTVPKSSNNYPEEQRTATVLTNLACSFFVSNGASVKPLGDAPILGTLGDYSKPQTYRVTAASGVYKDWTITVSEFQK